MPEAPAPKTGMGAGWDSVLADFEADVQAAQNAGAAGEAAEATEPWTAPQDLGPLPARLAERAARILSAQRHALRALEHAKEDAAKHLAALDAIPSVRAPLQSVYLDVEG
ncbi:hypothetical protein ACIQCN_13420 [Pseudarthrobacter sp. NPDC092424]|uniref:hypothetical protein n=1 Tax=Pseudarthrobacter sp. NPDC092424 TaxID=3364415 RepID=UPI0038181BC2